MVLDFIPNLILALTVLILPGLALALNIMRRGFTWPEFLSVGATSGLTLNMLSMFFLNLVLKKPLTFNSILLASVSMSILLVLIRIVAALIRREDVGWGMVKPSLREHGLVESLVLVFSLAFIVFLTLGVHSEYPLPYQGDEWTHLSSSVQVMERRGLTFVDPNFADKREHLAVGLEAGFHFIQAMFFILSGFEPVLSTAYLPALVTLLTCLNLYSLVLTVAKDFRPAFYSILFFAGLRTSMVLLGPWLLVPHSMGFAFIYFVLYCFEKGGRELSRMHYVGVVNLLGASLTHPQAGAMIYVVISVYSAVIVLKALMEVIKSKGSPGSRVREVLKSYKGFLEGTLVYILFPLVSFSYFFTLIGSGGLEDRVRYFVTKFIFFGEMLDLDFLYTPEFAVEHYRLVSLLFFVVGFMVVFFGRRHAILTSGVIPSLAIIGLYQVKGYTVLMAYERVIYYSFIFMIPVSGMGLWYSLRFIEKKLGKHPAMRYFTCAVVVLIAGSFVYDYYEPREGYRKFLEMEEYEALKWFESYSGGGRIILARLRISNTVYPVSRNKVVEVSPRGTYYNVVMKEMDNYFLGRCEGKLDSIRELNDVGLKQKNTGLSVEYVLDNQMSRCYFLKEVYSKDGVYIYRVAL
ncbi:MAG: hypothetical protein ABIH11_06915 [Candidatus Altiarchaeota archaeon]